MNERPSYAGSPRSLLPAAAGLVAAAGLLWFLWPAVGIHPLRPLMTVYSGSRFVVQSQAGGHSPWSLPIVLPSIKVGWEYPGSASASVRMDAAKILDRNAYRPTGLLAEPWDDYGAHGRKEIVGKYEPLVAESSVFQPIRGDNSDGRIKIGLSPGLTGCIFDMAALNTNSQWQTGKQWMVKAFVEFGTDGQVSRVLLENRAKREELNTAIERMLREGRAGKLETPREGNVTLFLSGL